MAEYLEFSVQPYISGVTDGPEIRVRATTPLGAVTSVVKEHMSFRGRFGQLRAYVSYFDTDGRAHRVRYYRAIVS